MRLRESLLGIGLLALVGAAGMALLGGPTAAGELPPPPSAATALEGPGDASPGEPAAVAMTARPSEVALADGVFHPSTGRDTTGWTSGLILGDIPLTPQVVERIGTISVVVDELRNVQPGSPPPFRKVVPVKLGVGTPTFEVKDVPFSDYGYVVRVHAPGLNGGQATVSITKDHPVADDVALAITPGSPFSILLRDQDHAPLKFTELRVVPYREPHGRPTMLGETDNFGAAVFEDMLAGDYLVHVGPQASPLMEPALVTVQPGSYVQRGSVVLPQGTTILVPRGVPVHATVVQHGGYPMQDAIVTLRQTDRTRVVEMEVRTDVRGLATFPNVLPGQWELEVYKPDFERRLKQLRIAEGDEQGEVRFDMIRLR